MRLPVRAKAALSKLRVDRGRGGTAAIAGVLVPRQAFLGVAGGIPKLFPSIPDRGEESALAWVFHGSVRGIAAVVDVKGSRSPFLDGITLDMACSDLTAYMIPSDAEHDAGDAYVFVDQNYHCFFTQELAQRTLDRPRWPELRILSLFPWYVVQVCSIVLGIAQRTQNAPFLSLSGSLDVCSQRLGDTLSIHIALHRSVDVKVPWMGLSSRLGVPLLPWVKLIGGFRDQWSRYHDIGDSLAPPPTP